MPNIKAVTQIELQRVCVNPGSLANHFIRSLAEQGVYIGQKLMKEYVEEYIKAAMTVGQREGQRMANAAHLRQVEAGIRKDMNLPPLAERVMPGPSPVPENLSDALNPLSVSGAKFIPGKGMPSVEVLKELEQGNYLGLMKVCGSCGKTTPTSYLCLACGAA